MASNGNGNGGNGASTVDVALDRAQEINRLLREIGPRLQAIDDVATRTASAGTEQAAAAAEVRASIESVAVSTEETGSTVSTLVRSHGEVTASAAAARRDLE